MASPDTLFPLIRQLSVRVTPALLRSPLTANQITALSLLFGIAACAALATGITVWAIWGGVFLIVSYVLDNCDGEIARAKNQSSAFGAWFDTFVDWIVNAGVFAAIGWGTSLTSGNPLWWWLGLAAAAGGTINYAIGLASDLFGEGTADAPPDQAARPQTAGQWTVYIFRELLRADFCFIVFVLAPFDAAWVLVPTGAIGAQVYWMSQLAGGARDYHV